MDTPITFIEGGGVPPFIDIGLTILNDFVPGEDVESFDLTLTQPSDPRVVLGGAVGTVQFFQPTRISIVDDDGITGHVASCLQSCMVGLHTQWK